MRNRKVLFLILIILAMVFGSISNSFAQMQGNKTCEACGMTVMSDAQAQFKIKDENGTMHYAECLMCAFKLLKTYDQLNITTFCDWYGPNATIAIIANDHGETISCNDTSALFMNAGGCTKTRVAFNQTAVDALLTNGYSNFTTTMLRTALPANTTIMTLSSAAKMYGGGIPDVSPSPSVSPFPTPSTSPTSSPSSSPTPTITISSTPNPTIPPSPTMTRTPESSPKETQQMEVTPSPTKSSDSPATTPAIATPSPISVATQPCEACGMDVSPAAQEKYIITDGTGKVHYAECFMCALNLIKNYDQLHVVTSCDWYGPNYTITIDSSQFGKVVTVSPATAIFLNGGSCVVNRAAYNQTAADELLKNGFSQNTLSNQQYALPGSTTSATLKDAAIRFSQNSNANDASASPTILILIATVGIGIIALAVVAFRKLKK